MTVTEAVLDKRELNCGLGGVGFGTMYQVYTEIVAGETSTLEAANELVEACGYNNHTQACVNWCPIKDLIQRHSSLT